MRRKWMLLMTISYVVSAVFSLPVSTTQPSQGSEISTVNSKNSEVKSKLSPAPIGLDNSDKDNKVVKNSNETVNATTTEGDKINRNDNSKVSSSDGSKTLSDQPDDENTSSKSTVQINDSGAAPPETPSSNNNTSNEKEHGSGDGSNDETVSETGDNPSLDNTEGNDTNAEDQTAGESGKSSVVDPKDKSNPTDGSTVKEKEGSTVKEKEGSTVKEKEGSTVKEKDGSTVKEKDGSTVKEKDGSKGDNTIDESAKPKNPEAPSTGEDANGENEDSSHKEQGVIDNPATSGVSGKDDKNVSPSDKKSSFAPDQGGAKDVTVSVDQEYVDSQQSTQKQNGNPDDEDDFESYYQDGSKSSMDGSVPQVGPSYDDADAEEPVREEDRQQYDDKQTFISGGGQNQKMGGQFTDDEDSHFFAYFLTIMVTAIIFYLVFHNKQRIIALIIEGRVPRNGRGRRSSGKAKYHKLDNNLEEAITATKGSNGF